MSWADKPGYTMYTRDESKEQVATLFEARHGYTPAEVLDTGAVWLAGPIEELNDGQDYQLTLPLEV